jgi:hypothetical protein
MSIVSKNNLYAASLLFRSLRNGEFCENNLWEESIVLIDATSNKEALALAMVLGKEKTITYSTVDGDKLTWEFVKVERIFLIGTETLVHGIEIFARHLRNSEVNSLLTPFDD